MQKPAYERRRHKRLRLPCPITLYDSKGEALCASKTIDVSDGGVFLQVPLKELPGCGAKVSVALAVPRTTENTYMLEEVDADAVVVRHQPMKDETVAGIGVEFQPPRDLMLEV